MIQARKKIVEGATDIVADAVEKLRAKGVTMSTEEISKMSGNLIVSICGD